MRGTLLIGLAVVLLIIGLLVIKNTGVDTTSGVQETQTKQYMEKAKNAADDADQRIKDIQKQTHEAD
jgi:hypothetical protein